MSVVRKTSPQRKPGALDEAAIARLWSGIGARRRALSWRRRGLAVATLGALSALVWVSAFSPSRMPSRAVAVAVAPPTASAVVPAGVGNGPVHMASAGAGPVGSAPEVLSASDKPARFGLDDGSVIELSRGARLDTRANTATAFTAHLEGSGTFEVKPGGPRRWSIVANLLTVDVIGTRFQILEEPAGERVVVDHGIVVVRGDGVPGHMQRLVDGQSLAVVTAAPEPSPSATTPPSTSIAQAEVDPRPTPPTPSAKSTAAAAPSAAPPPTWKVLANGGDYAAAYGQLSADGLSREASHASVSDLLMLADVARLSAHGSEAVAPLSRVVTEHASDPSAPLAAFTLGRLELDSLGHPAAAASAFARAIALGLPAGLVEDAYARLVEADVKAGDHAGARTVAADYARKFPHGRRAAAIEKWVANL